MELSPKVVAFSKALRLVEGCTSREQLDAAGNYINLFDKLYGVDRRSKQMTTVLELKLKERKKLL